MSGPLPKTSVKSPCAQPSFLWINYQSLRCCNSTTLTLSPASLSGKWILITGANSGIGREAALQFASWGASLVLACRPNPPAKEPHPEAVVLECQNNAKLAGHVDSVIEYWEVDMASLSSVAALAKRYLSTGRPLDVLCNNAGISSMVNRKTLTEDGFELVHQINFISHVQLTLSLLPALAKSRSGARVLCTTSNMQFLGKFNLTNANRGGEAAYANNKLYFQTWLTELQARLSRSSIPAYRTIVVHGVHPGYVQTNIWNAVSDDMRFGEWLLGKLLPYLGINSQQGSLCILHAATTPSLALEALKPNPKDGIVGAKFINRIWEVEPMPHTRHEGCRGMVWEFVEAELKLSGTELMQGL